MTDPLYTAKESAAFLQVSVPTIWRWASNGTLPKPVKLGGMSRWLQSDLQALIDAAKARRAAA